MDHNFTKAADLTPEVLAEHGHKPDPWPTVVREYCLWCCNDQPSEVAKCAFVTCKLWSRRFGTNPWRPKRAQSETQLANLKRKPKSPERLDEAA